MTIKELRNIKKMTQKEFAEAYFIPLPTLRHWEQGVSTPPFYFISLLEKDILPNNIIIDRCITREEYIYNMCRLENISVKREDMPSIIRRISTYSIFISDIPKIENMLRTFEYVLHSGTISNSDNICTINKLVDYGRNDETEGQLRNSPVKIIGTNYIPPIPKAQYFKRKVSQILKKEDKIDSSIELMLYLMKKQAFMDGNKRTAQFSAMSVLNGTGYIISIPFSLQRDFIKLLFNYYEDENNFGAIKNFIRTNALMKRGDF